MPAQSKLKRVTLQPLALRTRFDHLKARFVFPGKRSRLAEGYWHMLLEAIEMECRGMGLSQFFLVEGTIR